jgi:hypothetical protein
MAVADHPGGDHNPFLLYGAAGTGKSHLLHAIGHAVRTRHPATRQAVVSAERLTAGLLTALNQDKLAVWQKFFRNLDLLVIDDFGYLAGKLAVQEKLTPLLMLMVAVHRQLLIAAAQAPWRHEPSGFLPALVTLLQAGTALEAVCPEQLYPEIILDKARLLEVALPDAVVALLVAARVTNFRVLEGVIVRLHALSALGGVPLTAELARACLRDLGLTSEEAFLVPEERCGDHSEEFEQEAQLTTRHAQVAELQEALYGWDKFLEVARLINPELCAGAFVRRPCRRKLRYIGHDHWPEPARSELNAEGHHYFIHGGIYYSTHFNGATYSIEGLPEAEAGRVIGSTYFVWLHE